MSDSGTAPDQELIKSVWAEARDLVRRLEGSTVQRFAVAAGDYKIEIERGAAAPPAGAPGPSPELLAAAEAIPRSASMVSAARGVSGGMAALRPEEMDNRIPVLAPLVGTFYRASQPGQDPFVNEGDVVEPGQTVCIVEAMKLMNEVSAAEGGKVAEIVVENGEPVEFDQVLMYLEPAEGE
jgi:acetyl-CoA carboxylase biotin carboxyl carrier protein